MKTINIIIDVAAIITALAGDVSKLPGVLALMSEFKGGEAAKPPPPKNQGQEKPAPTEGSKPSKPTVPGEESPRAIERRKAHEKRVKAQLQAKKERKEKHEALLRRQAALKAQRIKEKAARNAAFLKKAETKKVKKAEVASKPASSDADTKESRSSLYRTFRDKVTTAGAECDAEVKLDQIRFWRDLFDGVGRPAAQGEAAPPGEALLGNRIISGELYARYNVALRSVLTRAKYPPQIPVGQKPMEALPYQKFVERLSGLKADSEHGGLGDQAIFMRHPLVRMTMNKIYEADMEYRVGLANKCGGFAKNTPTKRPFGQTPRRN
jgi:hypothetical protein